MPDYIPSKEVDLVPWALNAQTVLSAAPTDYGLDAGQVSSFASLRVAFKNAWDTANDPGTRTPVAVAAKDTAKADMLFSIRQLAQIARKYPLITDELLSDAGFTVPDPTPTPVPAPTSAPVLAEFDHSPLTISLRFRDNVLSNPRSKPQGAIAMQLYYKTGDTPPASIDDCVFAGQFSKIPCQVNFAPAAGGMQVHFIGRWVTRRGLTGPSSDTLELTIPA